jgi:cyclohexanone monooxygenase
VEVTAEAEQAWLDLLRTGAGGLLANADCTPGYYNNEGQPDGIGWAQMAGYPAGAMAYFQYLDAWRTKGDFEGLEFR